VSHLDDAPLCKSYRFREAIPDAGAAADANVGSDFTDARSQKPVPAVGDRFLGTAHEARLTSNANITIDARRKRLSLAILILGPAVACRIENGAFGANLEAGAAFLAEGRIDLKVLFDLATDGAGRAFPRACAAPDALIAYFE